MFEKNSKKIDSILITGHMGLIGSSLWRRLENSCQLYGADIEDKKRNDMSKKVDMIIHCASYCVIRDIIKYPYLMMKNISLTYSIMEKARADGSQVVLMSSGRLNSPYSSPYTVGKHFLENISKAYKECYDIDSIVIRPETIWGYHKKDDRVIPNWIKRAKNNEDIVVFGDKNKYLPPLFVEDFVDEVVKIIDNFDDFKNKMPITITGEYMNVCEIISIIKDFYKSESKVIFLPPEMSQPQGDCERKETDIILKNKLKENLR